MEPGDAPACVFGSGDTPLLPQLGSSLLPARLGMTGPYVSHRFLRGRLGGGRAERAEAGTLGDAHDSALGKGGTSASPAPDPGRQVPGFMDGCWSEISLPPRPPSVTSPGLFSTEFPPERPGLLWQQATPMLPPPPRPRTQARQQRPFPERKPSLLGSRQEPALTSRAEGTLGKGGVKQPGMRPPRPHTTGYLT